MSAELQALQEQNTANIEDAAYMALSVPPRRTTTRTRRCRRTDHRVDGGDSGEAESVTIGTK